MAKSSKPVPQGAPALALSARAAQLLLCLGAPLVFLHAIDYVVENSRELTRDLHNVDLFSGQGAIHRAFNDNHLKSKGFDKETSGDDGDITTTQGFLASIQLMLRAREGSLTTAGPPCGSFVFLNLFTSGRSKQRPLGFASRSYVREANKITARMCLLLLLGFIRCVVFLVEQPGSTLMLLFPYVAWLSRTLSNFVPWLTTRFFMGSYGHKNLKPTLVFGTCPWQYRLKKKLTKAVRNRHLKSKSLAKKYTDSSGRRRVCGAGKTLRVSQVYPKGYGKAVRNFHEKWQVNPKSLAAMREALYPPAGGLPTGALKTVRQAPYRWRHAGLEEINAFLISEKNAGRFHPTIHEGLDY